MGVVQVQIADGGSNTGYKTLAGVFEAKLTRTSGAGPGALTFKCGWDSKGDVATTKRFYPHLNVRVIEVNPQDGIQRKYFDGRIDKADLVENGPDGRVWSVEARDRLACLADNFIDKGQWSSAAVTGRGLTIDNTSAWIANYVGDYTGNDPDHPGEYRRWIIVDLAMNVIHDGLTGISDVKLTEAPNSKRIQWNADNNAMINILDAIRGLAASDPWRSKGSAGGTGAEVDGKDLADATPPFPDQSGFGGELQIVCNVLNDPPSVAEYYKRGDFLSGMNYSYGLHDQFVRGLIVAHDFGKQGTDIFSRTRVVGKGEGQYDNNVSGSADESQGEGIVVPGMETTWNPAKGLFHIRRENPNPRSQALVGEAGYEDQSDEKEAILARALRDGAYANLWSGAGSRAASGAPGGDNQGAITIAGPPNADPGRSTSGSAVLRPGDLVGIRIPQLGFDYNDHSDGPTNGSFVIQSWTFDFPMNQTTIMLARASYATAGTQLLNQLRNSQDGQSAHNDFYDTGWQASDHSGTVTVKHNLGVKPSKTTIEAAVWDGSRHDPNGAPLPTVQTTVTVPATGWDAAQGQNHGFFVSASDSEKTVIKFAHWLAYSDGGGAWLKHDDPNTLIRIRVQA